MPKPPAIPTAPDEGLRSTLAPSDSDELAPDARDVASDDIDFPDLPQQPAIASQRAPSQAVAPTNDIDFPDKTPQLEQVYQQVSHLDPERAAQVINFAKAIDQPQAYVDKNLDSVKRAAQAPSTSFFSELEQQHPETAKFLADPKNMAVTHDDIPNLAAHEGLVQDVKTAHGFIDAFKSGLEGSLPGLIFREKMPDLQLAPQKDQTWPEYLGAQVGGLAGDLPVMAAAGLGATPAVGPLGGAVASFALPAAAKQTVIGYLQNGDVKSAGDLLGRLYDNYKEAGKQGLVGLVSTLAGIPGAKFGGTAGKLAAEAIAMPTVASAEEGKLPTIKDIVGGALVMGGLHGLGAGFEGLADRVQADKSAESHDAYNAMGELAEKSKLRERSGDDYEKHVGQLVDGSPMSDAFMRGQQFDKYFAERGLNPDDVAKELGVTDSLNEARTQGEDGLVQIPFEKYTRSFAGTEHWAGLKPDVKFDPDELTPNEKQEKQATTAEMTQDAEKRAQFFQTRLNPEEILNDPRLTRAESLSDPQALTEVVQSKERAEVLEQHLNDIAQNSPEPLQREHAATTLETLQKIKDSLPSERSPEDASGDRIHREIESQLREAGLPPEQAQKNAHVLSSFYRVRGERMGQDPYSLYQERPIRIGRAEEATGEFHQSGNEPAHPVEQDLATRRSERALPEHVPVTSLAADRSFEGREPNEIRKLSLEDAKSAARGKVTNKAEGWDITLSGEGLKKSANYAKRPEQAIGLKNIRTLIEDAQYVRSEQRPGGIMHDYLYAPFEHDGRDYLAKVVVENVPADPRRNVEAHRKFYSLHVQETKSPTEGQTIRLPTPAEAGSSPDGQPLDGSASSRPGSEAEVSAPETSEQGIPLQDFLGRINQARETTKLFQSASPAGSATRQARLKRAQEMGFDTSKVWYHGTPAGRLEEFNPYASPRDVQVMFFTPDKEFARPYARGEEATLPDDTAATPFIHKVYLKTENTFDYDNSQHVDSVMKELSKEDIKEIAQDFPKINGKDMSQKDIRQQIGLGSWTMMENRTVFDALKRAGFDSMHVYESGIKNIAVFEPNQIRSVNAEFDPQEANSPKIYAQSGDDKLGSITIGDRQISIDLLKNANASTIIHEFGHAFLDIMARDAAKEDAPPEVKQDFQAILKFLGVNSHDEIQTEHHEKFAKAFETYLSEGQAPSEVLRPAFDRFKDWMLSVYGDIKQKLGIELSPEIRGVFDRMLATRQEIEEAQATIGQRAELIKGLPPEVARRLSGLEAKARSQAESTLLKEQMKEVTAKNKAFLAEERERITAAAEKEVREIPVFKASEEVRDGKRRSASRLADQFLDGALKSDEVAAFEVAAERNGFTSGDELAREILTTDSHGGFDAEVKERVDVGMQKHAAMMDTDAIRQKALEAVHSDRSTELLALERQTLQDLIKTANTRTEASRRNRIESRVEADAAKKTAADIISKKAVKDVNPGPYLTAERNAAVRVSKALAKGDYQAASDAKHEQLVNHALAGEAMRAQKEIQKTVEFLTDKAKAGRDFTKMPYAFARQVDQLLTRFGFKGETPEDLSSLAQIAEHMLREGEDANVIADATGLKDMPNGSWQHETLPDFIQRQNENYFGVSLPDVVMGNDKPYRQLSTSELSDLKDAVKTLTTLGKNRDRFLDAFDTADINEAGKKLAASIEENVGHPEARNLQMGSARTSKADKILGTLADIPKVLARAMDTMLTTCHKLDGLEADGPAKEFIYRRMSDAENRRLARTRTEMEALDEIFAQHFKPGELDEYKNSFVKVNGNSVSKEELLSMALNWGNLGNRDRITRGFGMSESEVEQLLFKNLGKRDFDFAQSTWNYLEKFKPEIKKLEMEVNGVEPKFVDPSPIITPWGAYDGGYYPISYDPERSASAYQYTEATTALYKQFGAAKAQTEQGHVQARVNSVKRPVSLSLKVLTNHIEDVIHDLEFRKPVIDVARFLSQKDAKGALLNALGTRGYNSINDWLKAVASGPSEPLRFGEQAARWLRFRTTMFYMGYRLASVPKIAIENLNNISNELGVSDAARAMKDYYMGESGIHDFVISKSEFMRQRAEHLDRDMGDVYDKYSGKEGVLGHAAKFAFWTHAILDQGVSFPLWTHVFKEAMANQENEALATQKADEAVKRSFMTGGTVDQAAIMRGGETQKAFTVALGYQSMMWNRYSQGLFATGQALRQGQYVDAAMIAARAHFYSFVMPAAIGVLAHEMVRNSQGSGTGDDEKKRIVGDSLKELTPLKFIPLARDVFPYFVDKSLGTHGSDLQVTPLERAAQTILEPAAEAFHSSLTGQPLSPRFGEKLTNAASLVAPVPKTVNDIVFNFLDWQKDHGALTWKDFVSRRSHH